jgi:citrate lyase alpha subunit
VDIICIREEIPQMSALVDFGTTSSSINQTFIAQHNILVVKKSTPVLVEVIDGRTIASGAITHETTPLELRISKHTEKIVLNIISTPHHPVILGLP